MNPLIEIKNLTIQFGKEKVVNSVSFSLFPGETVALLGESGSGKSSVALAIPRLISGSINGEILFDGDSILPLPENKMRNLRREKIGFIFQDPMTSLNPTMTIGKQILEVVDSKEKTLEILQSVGISEPLKRFRQYPHELSGGMRQRVMIAIAIAKRPKLLIADEPTTALDSTIQAQILELLKKLQKEMAMTTLLITHDLRIVAGIADKVLIMYAGRIVEMGTVPEIYHNPSHPYTQALLQSLPNINQDKDSPLFTIPANAEITKGCPFAARCHKKTSQCEEKLPPFFHINQTQSTSCWQYEKTN